MASNLEPSKRISVKRHGAKGDGSADDTAAIQEAIDRAAACAGSVVVFPAGVYRVTSTIAAGSAVTLIGEEVI